MAHTGPVTPFDPTAGPYGNARSLDSVSVDVDAQLWEAAGAHVYRGTVELHTRAPELAEELARGMDRLTDYDRAEYAKHDHGPAALVGISLDGSVVTADWPSRTEGKLKYGPSHLTGGFWRMIRHVGAATVVIDRRPCDPATAYKLAVRGPMVDPDLPPGSVRRFDLPDDPISSLIVDTVTTGQPAARQAVVWHLLDTEPEAVDSV